MLANIKNYRPESIEFVLSAKVKDMFPNVLFEGAENPEEIVKIVNEKFNALFPENEVAIRKMDEHEILEVREEYCLKQENDVPKRMQELADAIDTAKRMKKDAEDRYESLLQEIRNLAAMVKDGTKEFQLSSTNTARMALNGHYCFYSWVDGKFQLVKADKIPEWDKRSLWSQEDRNRQAMMELFGFELPEVQKPITEEDDDEEEQDEFNEEEENEEF